jgi:transcription initiation factor IIE alpha subunit
MYADDVDFYSLSETKKRRLVHNKRVATTDQLLNELSKGKPAVRIFERSLDQLVLDQLEQGQYTIEELANHFSVQPADVRRILHKYRRRGSDDFTNENFKLNLLEERHGVIRGVDSDGRSLYYTLQTIPFFARVVDPTLMFSLLGLDEYVDTLPHIAEHIPGGKVTELDEDYAFVIGEYWNIDPEEVFEYLTEFDRAYVDTSLLPLPYIEDDDHYERVSRRFRQIEGVYRMFRGTSDHIQEVGEEFIGRIEQNQAGIATYQVMSIDFADFEWYVDQSGDYVLHNEISDWVEQIARSLHPDEPTKDIDDSTEDTEINLRDEIQLILSEKHRTPAEIYEELPRDIQLGTDKSEVKAVLERLANTGVISKKNEESTFRYFQRQGKTWE